MSPTTVNDSEPEFPTHCPLCGTELNSDVAATLSPTQDEMADSLDRGSVMFADACPNPDCPGRKGHASTRFG